MNHTEHRCTKCGILMAKSNPDNGRIEIQHARMTVVTYWRADVTCRRCKTKQMITAG